MSEQAQVPVAAQAGELPPLNDDDVLQFTRGIRVKVIRQITDSVETKGMGADGSEKNLLVNMLNGLDSQALGNKRLQQDQKNNDNSAAIVAELLRAVNKNTAFTVSLNEDSEVIDVSARVVPPTIGDIPALPGEMDVAPPQLDYASFVRSQGKDIDQLGKNVKHEEAEEDDDMP
jgi:hypothetical protein